MSNYAIGYFFAQDKSVVARVVEKAHSQLAIGLHIIPVAEIPVVEGFPKSSDRTYFYLSHHKDTFLAGDLILEDDWDKDYKSPLPMKLVDRIALIVDAVHTIADVSQTPTVGLWLSEVDQLEGTAQVPLESLFETIMADFQRTGIPCILYEVTTQ